MNTFNFKEGNFPESWPFSAKDFKRFDELNDSVFYFIPRFVYHVDKSAVKALQSFYS